MAPAATTARYYSGSVSPVYEKRKGSRGTEKVNGSLSIRVNGENKSSYLFDRNLHKPYPVVTHGDGIWLYTKDKRKICDGSAGAAVAALGYGNERVNNAMKRQMDSGLTYIASSFWGSDVVEEACQELIRGTGGKMSRVYLTGSGWCCCGLLS
jgi:4-aminobutyrate aminotransferase-like enzyme